MDNIDGNLCLADKLCVFGQTEQFKLEVEKRVFPSIFTKSFRDFADFFNLSVTISLCTMGGYKSFLYFCEFGLLVKPSRVGIILMLKNTNYALQFIGSSHLYISREMSVVAFFSKLR